MTSEISETCTHCGGPVSTKGRRPKSGKRFCSNKGCIAAKARLRRQAFAVERDAPAQCSGCHMALPPRSWRAGDELGRWCAKPLCKQKRRALSVNAEAESKAIRTAELLENAIAMLADAVRADNADYIGPGSSRVTCRECGLTSALSGWLHITEERQACRGTLGDVKARPVQGAHLFQAWPGVMHWIPADELAEYVGD
jgi:hypothetical protein